MRRFQLANRTFTGTFPLFLVILLSCKPGDEKTISENPFPNYEDKYTLVEYGEKQFPLDSVTATAEENFQYYKDDDKEYFCYLNRKDNTILFYDYQNNELDFKLHLLKEGPDGVGKISGFVVHNLDSIFVYRYEGARLYLINQHGKVLDRYHLTSKDASSLYPPYVSGSMPMIKTENKIYLNAWGAEKEYTRNKEYPSNLVVSLDLQDKSLSYDLRYPEIYTTGIWGIQLHVMYNTYNPNTTKFVYSFPIDHNIYVTDHNGYFEKKYAGSKFIHKVEPLSRKGKISTPPIRQEVKLEATQGTYRSIKYDTHNDLYYRVAYKGINEEDFESGHPIRGTFSKATLIILDNNLKKVGEVELEEYKYLMNNMYFTKDGIHMMRLDYENEDILTFSIMKIAKK